MTPAELAIRAAVEAVERVGAHPLLTDAVNLLHEAQGRVADYVDTTAEPKPEPQPSACFTFAVGDTVRILNGDDPRTGKTADVIGLYPKECATLRVHGEPPPRAPDVYPAYPLTCLEPVEPQPSGEGPCVWWWSTDDQPCGKPVDKSGPWRFCAEHQALQRDCERRQKQEEGLADLVKAVADAWARYQRNDISREEFEGFIAERFEESSPGWPLSSRWKP